MPRYVYEGPRWFRTGSAAAGRSSPSSRRRCSAPSRWSPSTPVDSKLSGYAGLLLGVFAAPALLAVGAPFSSTSVYPIGVALSVLLWLIVGAIAAHRTTRDPMADVGGLLAHVRWLAGGIWVGASAALAVARFVVGDALV